MNPYMLNHYRKVARDMNNYVAASSQNYYRNQYYGSIRDQGFYETPSILNSGFSGFMAHNLNAIGMPSNVVNLGYRVGHFLDRYA